MKANKFSSQTSCELCHTETQSSADQLPPSEQMGAGKKQREMKRVYSNSEQQSGPLQVHKSHVDWLDKLKYPQEDKELVQRSVKGQKKNQIVPPESKV